MTTLEHAFDLVKAQASVRVMSEDEIFNTVISLAERFEKHINGSVEIPADAEESCEAPVAACDPKRSIKEKSIVCCECGKVFKVLTKRHLELHGLDPVSYRAKWGLKKGTPLTCKELQKQRRAKMKEMKLWEKRAMARAMSGGDGEL